ncbi:hypothetical protein UPYG_G00310100 [Umbra pygmaea]|uniref:PEHE domain-containing protein n=1 Tax=Umbra pygmaea TaxID=75934 RepID=A0ABD0VZ91_UMBPY
MAPALTKLTKEKHGIHLATPPNPTNMDADGAALNAKCDSPFKLKDVYAQTMWLNLSWPFLDTCYPSKSPLEFPNLLLSPLLQPSTEQYNTMLLSSPGSLLSLLSPNKNVKNSLVVCPGAQDMCNVPVTDHYSQGVTQQKYEPQTCNSVRGPGGWDIPWTPTKLCQEDLPSQYKPVVPTPSTLRQVGSISTDTAPAHPCTKSQAQEHAVTTMVEEAVRDQTRWHFSQQATLLGRAERIQRRLQALLAHHASRHCSLQLEGLKGIHDRGLLDATTLPAGTKPFGQTMMEQTHPSQEIQEFARRAQALIHRVQGGIDSDATDSSSDEDLEAEKKWATTSQPVSHGCEWRWQRERAEVGSRWTWLQLRVAELEERIQQLGDLGEQITSNKGGVILAESQPLTDRQIQQTLLTETAGLWLKVRGRARDPPSDPENEPSSPTRLLRNIERQSAQLSQMFSSLLPPLNLSPSSSPKDPWRWKELNNKAFNCDLVLGGSGPFSQRRPMKRKVNRRRRHLQVDASCVSARTRPLVVYHKPRLFINPNPSSHRHQDRSSLSTSPVCPCCAACDPIALCSDPACSSNSTLPSRTHPVLSLPSDTPLSLHLQNSALLREDWVQRPLPGLKAESSPVHNQPSYRGQAAPTRFSRRYSHKHHGKHRRGGALGGSLVRWSGSAHAPHKRAYRRGRKRRHSHSTIEDEEDFLTDLSDTEENKEEAVTGHTTHTCRQGPIRRRQGDSVFNIDDIVIPMSLAATTKMEKLQYKDIITPSWRVVETPRSDEREVPGEGKELLSDRTFSQRHLGCERREKLGWTPWDKTNCYRRITRSVSRSTEAWDRAGGFVWADMGVVRGDIKEDLTHLDRSWSHLDTHGALQECVSLLPWDKRVFPLCEEEEESLKCHKEEQDESEMTCRSSSYVQSHTPKVLSSAQSLFSTTPPPAGNKENNSHTTDNILLR